MRREIRPLTSLRGVVALWVVAHHCLQRLLPLSHWPAGVLRGIATGYVGVDIFFVLSGYMLAYVYRDMHVATLPAFWVRRAARVYPLNIVATALLALGAWAGFDMGVSADWSALPMALSMTQPFFTSDPQWLLVNWSVGIELVCYAGLPFLVLALRGLNRLGVVAALLCILYAENYGQTNFSMHWWGVFALQRCVPAFCLGVAAFFAQAVLRADLPPMNKGVASLCEIAVLCMIVERAGMGLTPAIPCLSALLIMLLYLERGVVASLLNARPVFWLGQISFSIYLLHLPIVNVLRRNIVSIQSTVGPDAAWFVYTGAATALVIALSSVTYLTIERPAGRWLRSRWLVPADNVAGSGVHAKAA